jgi:hypothetical protein
MTDDEFENLDRRRNETEDEAEQSHQRLDSRIEAWRVCRQSEDAALTVLEAAHTGSRAAMYQLLACMYALAPKLKVGADLDTRLRDAIEQFPEQSDRKRRWIAKDSYDVALTYALGLSREAASTKSNWRATLTQAGSEGVECTEEAFLSWIDKVGGEEKARRPDKREPFDIEGFGASIVDDGGPDSLFKVSVPESQELPGGLLLVLGKVRRREGGCCYAQPVEVFTDETVISASAKLKRRAERHNLEEAAKDQRKRAREEKQKQLIDEYGDRPPKRMRSKKKSSGVRLSKFRRRKISGPAVTDFMADVSSTAQAAIGGKL